MKNLLLVFFSCYSISNYAQYFSSKINSEKETTTFCLKTILEVKCDSFFDSTFISSNPIKRQVSIKNAVLDRMTVYDTLGQLQKTVVFLNNSEYHSIDLPELLGGVYFIVLENQNNIANRKIIIN